MMKHYGGQTMIAPLQTVLVRRPDEAFGAADPALWHYTDQPYLPLAQQEHDAFVNTLLGRGVEVVYHDAPLRDRADAIFVHDPALLTDRGAIILRMGKSLRVGEEDALEMTLRRLGVPILYRLSGAATAEGGDLMWLDERTLCVGLGFRTNAAGLAQLGEALAGSGVELVPVQLPYFEGPDACLHLMSLISMVDDDLAVVYRPLLPVPFYQLLEARGVELIDVSDEEFATMGTNVLALGPRDCLMLDHNHETRAALEAAGCRVTVYRGDELSLKAEGGATCLTRAILRETTD
ncbi:Amidinotransferase [Candidatus Promineifilum breve]|uniref:Amidinotransferase n=1 Tax=Candidatus Promineifilum breve TaxID=1806508 RepID=A0A160T432_9CHLR|nr:arginine deiminase family protein [Candidatus Promineifilum breve]CUS04542.2 Amidinotransferase [Candidatus Promineifilum breve]